MAKKQNSSPAGDDNLVAVEIDSSVLPILEEADTEAAPTDDDVVVSNTDEDVTYSLGDEIPVAENEPVAKTTITENYAEEEYLQQLKEEGVIGDEGNETDWEVVDTSFDMDDPDNYDDFDE